MRTVKLLEQRDWLVAGLELLRVRGIGGVEVGPLCRRVGVTKGSFYYHFENRDAFLELLIEHWLETCAPTPDSVEEFDRVVGLENRVRAVLDFIRENDLGRYDLAMRTWATEDEKARQAVESMDKLRLSATARLFEADGWAREAALQRAQTMYYFIAGRYEIEGRPPTPEEGAEFAGLLTQRDADSC
jgi:AcrR family transcriptional regulator